jgi:hypothetical protein
MKPGCKSFAIAALGAMICLTPLALGAVLLRDGHLVDDKVFYGADSPFARYLFYSNRPSHRSHVEKFSSNGQRLYSAEYTTDALGRRSNPYNQKNGADHPLLFVGCSVTFGEGLMDDQTIPAQISRMTRNTQTFNYAVSGYGPGHVLSYLRYFDLDKHFSDPKKVSLIFIWGDYLIERQTGSLTHLSWGGGSTPYYALNSGQLEFRGRMDRNFPIKYFLSRFLFKIPFLGDRLMRYMSSIDPHKKVTDADIDLSVHILRESFAEYRRQFKNDRFYVVLFPYAQLSRERLLRPLEASGIKVIDLTRAFAGENGESLEIKNDGHPSAAGAQLLAKKIIAALSLK